MKTAISLPDEDFHRVTDRARQLGMSRSEFFAVAARHYLEALDRDSVTARIDAALAERAPDPSSTAAVTAGRQLLAESDDW